MNVIGLGVALIAVGVLLVLATTADDIGWLLAVGGIIIVVVAALMPAMRNRS
jgi:hypothetical protein